MTIKSKLELKDDLIIFLKEMTTYEVPQIIFKQFNSESEYHDWLTKTIL